ncbi:MAG: MFS transporter [Burkholderiales bacterium]
MTPAERRATFSLASIFGLRMLGMFIILPVFALYADTLSGGHNRTLAGIAVGAYGLTQAILQIPFGVLSDRWGRKPTLYIGLLIFALGSMIAAAADSIYMVIFGRIVQGAGAVSAVVIALVADHTREEQRTKAMAIVGMTIGVTFALSMVAGPLLAHWIGVPGIFLMTGVLALAACAVVRFLVPDGPALQGSPVRTPFLQVLVLPELVRLNYGIFVLHMVLTSLFVVVPFNLRDAGLPAGSHWEVYLSVMLGAFVLMVPPMLWSERRGHQKAAFLGSIFLLTLGQVALYSAHAVWWIALALLVFFTAFNLLEASLPSLVSRTAPPETKGAAIGVYSSVQFFGTFLGGALGGVISQHYGGNAVFLFCAALSASWLVVAFRMRVPQKRSTPNLASAET